MLSEVKQAQMQTEGLDSQSVTSYALRRFILTVWATLKATWHRLWELTDPDDDSWVW